MLTVKVDCTCGQTIEEAIRDCLEFSDRCKCAVSVNMNDIWMLIIYSTVWGPTLDDMFKHYRQEFDMKMEERRRSHKESLEEQ